MNNKAFISLDTLISIFLLSMIIVITQNTSNIVKSGYSLMEEKKQEISTFDNLLYDICRNDLSGIEESWVDFKYKGQVFNIRKLYENEDFIKVEIKSEKGSYDEKNYEKIIFK